MVSAMIKGLVVGAVVGVVSFGSAGGEVDGHGDDGRRWHAQARERSAYIYRAVDGDTLYGSVEGRAPRKIRLRGIDAPELEGQCGQERRLAAQAQARLDGLTRGRRVILVDVTRDYYKRVLASVVLESGEDVQQILLSEGLAKPYSQRKRDTNSLWC